MKTKKIQSEHLFLVALFLYVFGSFIVLTWIEPFYNASIVVSNACKLTSLLLLGLYWPYKLKKRENKYLLCYFVVLAIVFLSDRIVGHFTTFWTFLLIGSSANLAFDRVVKVYFRAMYVSIIILICAHFGGLTTDVIKNLGYGIGHSWGTAHPNNLAVMLFSFSLCIVYLYYDKIRKRNIYIFLSAITIFIKIVTVSRTSYYCMVLLIVGLIIISLFSILKSKLLLRILRIAVVIIFVGSIYLLFNYDTFLTHYTSNSGILYRFSSALQLYKTYGLRLLGNHIEFISTIEAQKRGTSSIVLDSAYPALLISHGILVTILYFMLFYLSFRKAYKQNDSIVLLIMSIFMIHGLMEQSVINILFNIFILYLLCNTSEVTKDSAISYKKI